MWCGGRTLNKAWERPSIVSKAVWLSENVTSKSDIASQISHMTRLVLLSSPDCSTWKQSFSVALPLVVLTSLLVDSSIKEEYSGGRIRNVEWIEETL